MDLCIKDGKVSVEVLVEGGFVGRTSNGTDPRVSEGEV